MYDGRRTTYRVPRTVVPYVRRQVGTRSTAQGEKWNKPNFLPPAATAKFWTRLSRLFGDENHHTTRVLHFEISTKTREIRTHFFKNIRNAEELGRDSFRRVRREAGNISRLPQTSKKCHTPEEAPIVKPEEISNNCD